MGVCRALPFHAVAHHVLALQVCVKTQIAVLFIAVPCANSSPLSSSARCPSRCFSFPLPPPPLPFQQVRQDPETVEAAKSQPVWSLRSVT